MRILLTGASSGLGDALSRLLPAPADRVFLVSRREPPSLKLQDGVARQWIERDLTDGNSPGLISAAIEAPLDVLIHCAGTWESAAFTSGYAWEDVSDQEHRDVVDLNLVAPMLLTRTLQSQLIQSANPKVIFIGSTNGLENSGAPEIAYAASKWGVRGLAHSLREYLRPYAIGVTVINPGTIGDQILSRSGEQIGKGIPVEDIAALIRCVINCSRRTVVKEINFPAMEDRDL